MKKVKELFYIGCFVFSAQFVMLCICAVDFSREFPNNPMLYIYGNGSAIVGYRMLDLDMWMVNLILYCLFVIKKIASYRQNSAYMLLPRYGSYQRFYKAVYVQFVGRTFCYQIFLGFGAFCGCWVVRKLFRVEIIFELHTFMTAQLCMFLGNLFLGIIVFYCILFFKSLRGSVMVYPGIPIISSLLEHGYLMLSAMFFREAG